MGSTGVNASDGYNRSMVANPFSMVGITISCGGLWRCPPLTPPAFNAILSSDYRERERRGFWRLRL